jgi:transposase
MSYGLLKGAFRPADAICCLRAVVRQHASKIQEQARCIRHMQKALTQMNIQLDNVASDLMGKTGTAQRKAQKLGFELVEAA